MARYFGHGQPILQVFETPITLNVVESVKYQFFQPYWSKFREPYQYAASKEGRQDKIFTTHKEETHSRKQTGAADRAKIQGTHSSIHWTRQAILLVLRKTATGLLAPRPCSHCVRFVYRILANRSCQVDLSSSPSQTDLIIMDFSKAFDKVPHRRLQYKLNWRNHTCLDSNFFASEIAESCF